LTALCVAGISFHNLSKAANLSRELGKMLSTNWSSEFDVLTTQLWQEILNVSPQKLEALSVAQFAEAMLNATKAWSGMGVLFHATATSESADGSGAGHGSYRRRHLP